MKIRVTVSLEMTPEQVKAYVEKYELGSSDSAYIRREIREHVAEMIETSNAHGLNFFDIKDVK